MKKIESFRIDHDILEPGMYISRVDGDIVTYDIRTRKPNMGDYMSNSAIHTTEHIFATYVRNSNYTDAVIYFGPMGCRTGFYLLLKDSVSHSDAIALVRDTFDFISNFEGKIPGSDKIECGNYLEHNLCLAKLEAEKMLKVLEKWSEIDLAYPTKRDKGGE